MTKRLELPYVEEQLASITAGDEVLLSGALYVGRDQVHSRLYSLLEEGGDMPFDFRGNAIYYMGPSPAPLGYVIGACGPTTSQRMDAFSPDLLKAGLRVMVGKGPRSSEVVSAVREYHGLYLQAYGGCGALYASAVRSTTPVAWPELGPEALVRLEVEDFPVICLLDSHGGNIMRS